MFFYPCINNQPLNRSKNKRLIHKDAKFLLVPIFLSSIHFLIFQISYLENSKH
ncbi:hypothetical protein LEP1GSC019_1391 [Leptospira interrogans serovar Pyrogenes str. 2006006960]|uniref:Uncharacterized protein n=2 Tax=Leptospira interrogans TaxID=173 RepID=A0A0F6H4M8_LEPIR|nr:hypothetical protein LEP1GSC104_0201 [Leptospira interrogans str. UI 12621]EKR18637.1 hypothetical protein LEP1GSC019_1391 [Leptospira interrogans serovar Pyrogenes str. 2006006960]EMM93584.1 hypothetical protein LEP1GSC158_5003 [Leptospira interrogans serovar Zanoni str. LT2156]